MRKHYYAWPSKKEINYSAAPTWQMGKSDCIQGFSFWLGATEKSIFGRLQP